MGTRWFVTQPGQLLPEHCLCVSQQAFDKVCAEWGIKDRVVYIEAPANARVHTLEHPKKGIACVVCCPKDSILKKPLNVVLGVMVHEAPHIWQRYRTMINEEAPSKEFEAYCMQRIAQNLISEVLHIRKVK